MFDDDIVRDILRRVVEATRAHDGGFSDTLAIQIEQQVREEWGGCEPYIAHGKESRIISRNEKIQALWDSGNHDLKILSTRFGLSVKQLRRILGL